MKLKVLVAAMIAGGLVAGAWAKGPAAAPKKSDFREFKQEMAAAKQEAAPPAANTVGDQDSFGRNARYIGLMSTGGISLTSDCTPDPDFPPGPEDHCFVVNNTPVPTAFSVPDAARMVIPAKASNSLFCHMQTPVSVTQLRNSTAAPFTARIIVTPSYTFQNAVLNDPTMIDPTTGLPFNGKLTQTLAGIRHQLTLQPGELEVFRDSDTRACIAGMISKQQLKDGFGLTDAQATNFFKNDTVITMSVNGSAAGVDFSSIIYGTRWLGD
jgi:hypothetical protein